MRIGAEMGVSATPYFLFPGSGEVGLLHVVIRGVQWSRERLSRCLLSKFWYA